MIDRQYWVNHFSPTDPELLKTFLELTPQDCEGILESIGASTLSQGVTFESAENRVFGFDNIVLKFFRPGRWSLEALQDELRFLEDLHEANVPFVRPIGGIGKRKGIYYLAYSAISKPHIIGRETLDEESVRQLVQLLAKVHEVGSRRDAPARPHFDPESMGYGCLEVISKAAFLPKELHGRYQQIIETLIKKTNAIGEIPVQRIHGDSYGGNVAWQTEGPMFIDLDDFQVGPTALDIKLLSFPWRLDTLPESMDRRERRKIQHQLVLDLYRDIRPFPKTLEPLFPLLSVYRDIQFDAWFSARWSEPEFSKNYPDEDITSVDWWKNSIERLEGELSN